MGNSSYTPCDLDKIKKMLGMSIFSADEKRLIEQLVANVDLKYDLKKYDDDLLLLYMVCVKAALLNEHMSGEITHLRKKIVYYMINPHHSGVG